VAGFGPAFYDVLQADISLVMPLDGPKCVACGKRGMQKILHPLATYPGR
jgi:hypothetical protein